MAPHRFALPLACLTILAACGAGIPGPSPAGGGGSGPAWAREADQAGADGNRFVCEGEGKTEGDALAAAHGLCGDKLCKICGVEVESVVQTTETLKGVEMSRKVVERCRRFRRSEPPVQHQSTDCGPNGCVAWLSIFFSKEDQAKECSSYASEHFADASECQTLIATFRKTPGRTAASFRTRMEILDAALAACADIDVRPTPLIDALHEQLFAGLDVFEFTPGRQQERLEEPFFDTTWYHSRAEMMQERSSVDAYLTTYQPLRQRIRETPTLLERIRQVRDYVANRALVFDVIEATLSAELDSPAGTARLLHALHAAPPGGQYGSGDVHFLPLWRLAQLRTDVSAFGAYYMKAYPADSVRATNAPCFSDIFAHDRKVDDAEWAYGLAAFEQTRLTGCVLKLVDAPDHGAPAARDARFVAYVAEALAEARSPEQRKRAIAGLMPGDERYMTHARMLLPPDLRDALGWDFYRERVEHAEEGDDPAVLQELLPLLSSSLAAPGVTTERGYCASLAGRLAYLADHGAPFPAIGDSICSCLTGPLGNEPTRQLVNKSELYDVALERSFPCVRPR